ncbi:MAG TPA: zinc ABC transporter substrate-binding protein [Dehalococcoidia bacterium]|nr:zinc ABC transporter substrate-binding protein [Dehalococcoidia bacterium]
MRAVRCVALLLLGAVTFGLLACDTNPPANGHGGKLRVVAAENVWGSIAAQLGGDKVSVTSIISKPQTDPHDYEPTPRDARNVAAARYVLYNGIGYDGWAGKLVAAGPNRGRAVLVVGDLLGIPKGGNPHRWYAPEDVRKVIGRITSDLKQLDAGDAVYFDQRQQAFLASGLQEYTALIQQIEQRYAGTPVGASESVFVPLAQALGLKLLTPESFLDAVSEGSDPSAADKATADRQIKSKQIAVYVYNSQNATPDVQNLVNAARAANIPVVAVTETLTPATATFQAWQSAQLQALAAALAQATGK